MTGNIRKWAAATALAALGSIASSAWAQAPSPQAIAPAASEARSDSDAIMRAAWRQIEAIEQGDAQAVFSGMSPEVRALSKPEALMGEMLKAWPIKLGVRSATFEPAQMVEDPSVAAGSTALQTVKLRDAMGSGWVVVFVMQRQLDASWTVSACVAAAAEQPRKGQDV